MLFTTIIITTITALAVNAAGAPQTDYQIQETNDEIYNALPVDFHESDSYFDEGEPSLYEDSPVYKYSDDVQPEHEWIDMMAEHHHEVKLISRCRSGKPAFLYEGHPQPRISGTIQGPVRGGVAWMEGYDGAHCQSSGVNCGIVEFTLTNSEGKGMQNSADYSLLDGPGLGNHKFHYKMNFHFTGSCTKGPGGPCTGDSPQKCPGAYLGDKTEGGAPTQCLSDNTGITITFC
ncbi:hypothetical protein L486_07347 [Kwoniella mangroviensis CBS 10435]|uniref:Uncharacterized protein n=1 Tax=Kwoniella mangroviensis CBS 10435 TaxID=1331196 RepID=A0A1B9IIM7_9TREE|nr:hypothetical protein L486_07347 [Kwoniella mangroviensis CBS 10435]